MFVYSGGTSVSQRKGMGNNFKETFFYRGSDMGGGVGGINYAEFADGTDLNYKFYNLRGDVIVTLDTNNNVKSRSMYTAFGTHETSGAITTDSHRANTKVEDADNLLNEGRRFRHLEYAIFLTPDPLEYVDGLNSYIYVSQNPWGRFDPLGLTISSLANMGADFKIGNWSASDINAVGNALMAGQTWTPVQPGQGENILADVLMGYTIAIPTFSVVVIGVPVGVALAPEVATTVATQLATHASPATLYCISVELSVNGAAVSGATLAATAGGAFTFGLATGVADIDDAKWANGTVGSDAPLPFQAAVTAYEVGNTVGRGVLKKPDQSTDKQTTKKQATENPTSPPPPPPPTPEKTEETKEN